MGPIDIDTAMSRTDVSDLCKTGKALIIQARLGMEEPSSMLECSQMFNQCVQNPAPAASPS